MIPFDEALQLVLKQARPLPSESVPVLGALGRVLREDLEARHPIPPFDRSAMDGYAVRAEDVATASEERPAVLQVLEDVPAGRRAKRPVGPGRAVRIMTGAALPRGADAVVMVEFTKAEGQAVKVLKPVPPGENLVLAGEDVEAGQVVVAAGAVIGPAEMGMLAAVGKNKVKVSRRPRVAVISTGDEIVEPGKTMKPGQIRDANGYSLFGMARAAGAQARFLGIARDTKSQLLARLRRAQGFDLVVLSGGVSVGDYDLVQDILLGRGVKQIFWKVAIKPGMPIFVGRRGRQVVFGLPGNPVSCMVTFGLFVQPLLDAMQGKRQVGLLRGRARLAADVKVKTGRRHFLRGVLAFQDLEPLVTVLRDQHSGVLRSMVEANVLVDVPDDITGRPAGTEVEVWHLA
jgi:molybdopterin molybdotransferase